MTDATRAQPVACIVDGIAYMRAELDDEVWDAGVKLYTHPSDQSARIAELCHALLMAKRALEESAELVFIEYAKDGRHGMPTRAKQLSGMKALVDAHYAAIASAQAALEQEAPEAGFGDILSTTLEK